MAVQVAPIQQKPDEARALMPMAGQAVGSIWGPVGGMVGGAVGGIAAGQSAESQLGGLAGGAASTAAQRRLEKVQQNPVATMQSAYAALNDNDKETLGPVLEEGIKRGMARRGTGRMNMSGGGY